MLFGATYTFIANLWEYLPPCPLQPVTLSVLFTLPCVSSSSWTTVSFFRPARRPNKTNKTAAEERATVLSQVLAVRYAWLISI